MEVTEALCQQDRLQLIAEKRKWQTEIENKKRQLEDDRRALQHLKSKALRERWLLDGAPSAGPEQDEAKTQLQQDEAQTRTLEDTISRLEQELVHLESGGCETLPQTIVTSGPVKAVEVKGHGSCQKDKPEASVQVVQEVKGYKSPRMTKPREATEEMKRAMYSVEIKVERDRVTGETRVLSTNTTLPVDLSLQGVKVYEDERKVVHEMNGDDVQMLSSMEVEELIHKADEASMMSETVVTVTSLPSETQQEEEAAEEEAALAPKAQPPPVEITGMESKASGEPSVEDASAENPVTMVFMGYQSVEDEDETKKVLGLQGTVKVELVVIDDGGDGKTSPPPGEKISPKGGEAGGVGGVQTMVAPPTVSIPPSASTKPPETVETAAAASNGEMAAAGEAEGGVVQIKKEKQPCKCCSIM